LSKQEEARWSIGRGLWKQGRGEVFGERTYCDSLEGVKEEIEPKG
jgi:hypothetical protein